MGVGTIPVTEILAYGKAFKFEDLDELLARIRAADQVFMEWNAARKSAEAKGVDNAAEVAAKLGIKLPEDSTHGQSQDVTGRGGAA
jgi:hypothetical protein